MKLKVVAATGAAGLIFLTGGGALANTIGLPGGVIGTFTPIHKPVVAAKDGVVLLAKPKTEVATLTKTYAPGEVANWHDHPGIVIATIASGEVTRWVDKGNDRRGNPICVKEPFKAGDSFTEVEAHKVKNFSGTVPAVLSLTTIHPDTDLHDDTPDGPFGRPVDQKRVEALDKACK